MARSDLYSWLSLRHKKRADELLTTIKPQRTDPLPGRPWKSFNSPTLRLFHVQKIKSAFSLKMFPPWRHFNIRRTAGRAVGFLLQLCFELTSAESWLRCCRVYSQISRAALTWTLRERMTPCWGISTQTSNIWSKFAGMPSRSFLEEKKKNIKYALLFRVVRLDYTKLEHRHESSTNLFIYIIEYFSKLSL